jgi:hypothetical protein
MPEATHDIELRSTRVVKRFRSWERGEPDREWRGLQLLAEYAPGLSPKPVERWSDGGRPVVAMSRLPGSPLGSGPLSDGQVAAVAEAMRTLHAAVPPDVLERLPSRLWPWPDPVGQLRGLLRTQTLPAGGVVAEAFEAGAAWIESAEASRFAAAEVTPVFANADGNLANYLWDGERCRLVDFEDSGAGDLAFEVADLVEHVSSWLTGALEADDLVRCLDLDGAVARRVRQARRVMAVYWLIMLLPGNPGHARNPPDSLDRQARRLLVLLG